MEIKQNPFAMSKPRIEIVLKTKNCIFQGNKF